MDTFSFFDSIYKLSMDSKEALKLIIQTKNCAKNEIIQDVGSS